MTKKTKGTVYAGSFDCMIPLKMLETCAKCVKEGKCRNRCKLLSILLGKKKLNYVFEGVV